MGARVDRALSPGGRRRWVLALWTLAGLGALVGLGRLGTDFSPEELVVGAAPPATADPVLVTVWADDVLADAPLSHLHTLSRRLERLDGVDVVSPTVTPVPQVREHAVAETLDDLDVLDDDLGTVDVVLDAPPEMMVALADLAAALPERYPGGLGQLATEVGGTVVLAPLVGGDEPTDVERASVRRLAESPLVRGRLVAPDRTVAAVVLLPRDGRDLPLSSVREAVAQTVGPAGVETRVLGLPVLREEIEARLGVDQLVLVPLAVLANALLLFVGLRRRSAVLMPLGVAGTATLLVMGGMGWLGIPLDIVNNVVPALLITVGLADAVHLWVRHTAERAAGHAPPEAARRAVASLWLPCLATSLTTAVGFASLVVARAPVVSRFGLLAAAGVGLVWIVTMTLAPVALADDRSAPPPVGLLEQRLAALGRFVARRAAWVVAGALVLTAIGAMAPRPTVQASVMDPFDADDPVRTQHERLTAELPALRELTLVVTGVDLRTPEALAVLDRVERRAAQHPGVASVVGPRAAMAEAFALVGGGPPPDSPRARSALASLVGAMPPAGVTPLLSADGRRARVAVAVPGADARTVVALGRTLAAEVRAGLPGAEVAIEGEPWVAALGLQALLDDLLVGLGLAVVSVFALLALTLRSPRLALLSVFPNLAPLGGTLLWMGVRGMALDTSTVVVFAVSLGLAVDGTIHVLSAFREHSGGGAPPPDAIPLAMRTSGRAVLLGGATLVAGFAVLLLSGFAPVRRFGELGAVTLVACVAADLVLLPALAALWGTPRAPRGAGPRSPDSSVARAR